eukprot:1246954-Pyramimonas_sp.AAC.2
MGSTAGLACSASCPHVSTGQVTPIHAPALPLPPPPPPPQESSAAALANMMFESKTYRSAVVKYSGAHELVTKLSSACTGVVKQSSRALANLWADDSVPPVTVWGSEGESPDVPGTGRVPLTAPPPS